MAIEKIVLGLGALGSATLGCALYGYGDATGNPLPHRAYVWPATGLAALYVGASVPLPDNGPSAGFGGMVAAAIGITGAACYGVGYLVGSRMH